MNINYKKILDTRKDLLKEYILSTNKISNPETLEIKYDFIKDGIIEVTYNELNEDYKYVDNITGIDIRDYTSFIYLYTLNKIEKENDNIYDRIINSEENKSNVNFADGMLQISSTQIKNCNISIFNTFGQCVSRFKNQNLPCSLSAKTLKGIYIVRAEVYNNAFSQRIIIP